MNLLLISTITLLILSIFKAFFAVKRIEKSIELIDNGGKKAREAEAPNLIVVIPVLREQRTLEETLRYFSRLSYPSGKLHLLVVTTEREFRERPSGANGKTTIDLARRIKKECSFLQLLHYPDPKGLKSDQMNYAVENFSNLYPTLDPQKTFYVFYDADSRPAPNVFEVFRATYSKQKEGNIFQQSAVYAKNYFDFNRKGFFSRLFLKAQTLKQTRFIFAYEIPRIQRVYNYCSGKRRSMLNFCTYAPCIAHGLFVRVALLQKIKFPCHYTPEDMFWGFVVSCLKEPMVFLPSLDNSETPDSIKKVFFQLASWFKGPFLSYRYRQYVQKYHSELYRHNRLRINMISCFALWDGINWLLTSALIYFYIVMGILFGWRVWLLLIIFLGVYEYGCLLVMNRFIHSSQLSTWEKVSVLLSGGLVLLFHSLPAYYSIWNLMKGVQLANKTER